MSGFENIKKWYEFKGVVRGVMVIDDFVYYLIVVVVIVDVVIWWYVG